MLYLLLLVIPCWANVFERPSNQELSQDIIFFHNIECDNINKLMKNIEPTKYYCDNNQKYLFIQDNQKNIDSIKNTILTIDHKPQNLRLEAMIVMIHNSSQIKNYLSMPQTISSLYVNDNLNWSSLLNTLFALEQKNIAKVIASPKIQVINNQWATIETGQEIPLLTTSKKSSELKYKKAVFNCQLKARLLPKNDIQIDVVLQQDSLSHQSLNTYPILNTNTIETTCIGKLDQIFTIAGLTQVNNNIAQQSPANHINSVETNKEFKQMIVFVRALHIQ